MPSSTTTPATGEGLAGPPPSADLSFHTDIGAMVNAVERFSSKLAKRRLKRAVFCSVVELQAAIRSFLAEANLDPRPFRWTSIHTRSSER
jgi:hypothetical protein